MRIGVFDSGLGGLLVTKAIADRLPEYDLVYFGDTARVPYGDRSQATILEFTRDAVEALFEEFDCQLVVLACNTASAQALRSLQQTYLPTHFPERRILGVIIPTIEEVTSGAKVGLIGTRSTIASGTFERELRDRGKDVVLIGKPAPLLVPMIENDALRHVGPILDEYVKGLEGVQELILGCTHYGLVSDMLRSRLPNTRILSQEEIVPAKLEDYLRRHPEIDETLSRGGSHRFVLTDVLDHYSDVSQSLIGIRPSFERYHYGESPSPR